MKEALDKGAKGLIKKPFLPEDIRSVLYEVIGVGNDGEYQDDSRNADDFLCLIISLSVSKTNRTILSRIV